MRQLFPIATVVSLVVSFLVSFVVLFAAGGCASTAKNESAAAAAKPASSAAATADKAKAEVKADVKSAAKAVKGEAAKVTASAGKLECAHGGDKRILEVRKKDKGCELGYTKNGQEAVVSTSGNGTAHCEGSLTKIKDKLAGAGFTCN